MINKTFAFHTPSEDGKNKIDALRIAFSEIQDLIIQLTPPSREQSTSITQLETASMWAVKAVVFNDPDSKVVPS